jgi:hypothetical protein
MELKMTEKLFIGVPAIHTRAMCISEKYNVERHIVEDMIVEECNRESHRCSSRSRNEIIESVIDRVNLWLNEDSDFMGEITAVMIAECARPFLFFNKLKKEYYAKQEW